MDHSAPISQMIHVDLKDPRTNPPEKQRCFASLDCPSLSTPHLLITSVAFDKPVDDLRKCNLSLGSLVIGRLTTHPVWDHYQLEVRNTLHTSLCACRLLEVVPDDRDRVNPSLFEGCGVEHTARRAGPSEPDANDRHLGLCRLFNQRLR